MPYSESMRRRVLFVGATLATLIALAGCQLFIDASRLDIEAEATDPSLEGGDGARDGAADGAADGADAADPDLVGYWSFDEGTGPVAHDTSGRGNDGALGAGTSWAAGKVRGALSFDGKTGVVIVPKSPSLVIRSSLTIAMWIRFGASAASDMRLLSKGSAYDVKLNVRAPQLSAPAGENAQFEFSVPPEEWHHIAMTFASGEVKLYVDGISRTPKSNTFPKNAPLAEGGDLFIGAFNGRGENSASGLLDEVRLYSRVLEVAEIRALAAPPP